MSSSPIRVELGKAIHRLRPNAWTIVVIVIAFLISTPVISVLSTIFTNSGEVWKHLAETVLGRYIANSFWLMIGVGVGVLVIGAGTAWLVTLCRFPGSRLFEWALLLPLAAPAYVLAYTYTDLLDYSGPVQTTLRKLFGWGYGDYWFPNVRSLGGAIAWKHSTTSALYSFSVLIPSLQGFIALGLAWAIALQQLNFFSTVEASLGKIKPSLNDAARSIGLSPTRSLLRLKSEIARYDAPTLAATQLEQLAATKQAVLSKK